MSVPPTPPLPVTLMRIAVRIEDGKPVFDPPPGKRGYQFSQKTMRGIIVFIMTSPDAHFCGCSFHPTDSGMPGVDARWSHACRDSAELVVTFDYPDGARYDGHLRLFYMDGNHGEVLAIDPQVGNDGQTGGGHG